MVAHGFVQVEVSTRRGIETGQQLIHHHEKLHVCGLFDEQVVGSLFVGFGLGHARLGVNGFQKLGVGVEDELLVGVGVGSHFFFGYVGGQGIVGCDHSALATQRGLLEQREIFAGFEDAGSDKNGVAALAAEAGFVGEVKDDVGHDPFHTRA